MRKFFAVMFLPVFLSVFLVSEVHEYNAGGVSIWLPDSWDVATEEDTLRAKAPDGDMFTILQVIEDEETLDNAMDAYKDKLLLTFENFEATSDPEKSELNGMEVYYIKGSGEADEKIWTVDVAVLAANKAVVLFICSVEESRGSEYEAVYNRIVQSINPL